MQRVAPGSAAVGSFDLDSHGHARGGVATVIPLSPASAAYSQSLPLVRGRALATWMAVASSEIWRRNIRNHAIAKDDVRRSSAAVLE
eukprot:5913096-Pyramimonas_sp.AAC.1